VVTVISPGFDAGLVTADAGQDAGTDAGVDGGTDGGTLNVCLPTAVGCGCSAIGPGTLGLVAVMLALGALRRLVARA
jgi:hypothetical protein